VLVRNEPPPLLFIGWSTGAKRSETPRGWPLGLMDKRHVEAQDQPTQGQIGRSQGLPIPGGYHSGSTSSGWLSCGPLSQSPVYTCSWSGLGTLVGPWIHVKSMCLALSPRSCPQWRWTHPFVRQFDSHNTTWSRARHIAYSSIMPTLEINTSLHSSIRFA
jgi:hypothetical protein